MKIQMYVSSTVTSTKYRCSASVVSCGMLFSSMISAALMYFRETGGGGNARLVVTVHNC